jgi:hypothetical protein
MVDWTRYHGCARFDVPQCRFKAGIYTAVPEYPIIWFDGNNAAVFQFPPRPCWLRHLPNAQYDPFWQVPCLSMGQTHVHYECSGT